MSKIRLFYIAIVVLFAINIFTLGFLFLKQNRPFPRKNPKEIVVKKLHFDKEQVAKYEDLIKIHSQKIATLNQNIKATKNVLYLELSKIQDKKIVDSLIVNLSLLQNDVEHTHYSHFLDIKKLCKPNQTEDFNKLSHELAKIFDTKLPPVERMKNNPL